jgi:hypothetical protein
MEPLSHYHCEIYCYKHVPINLNHASTCTINKCINHAQTCTKQSVINLYHKQVQPTMYQLSSMYQSCVKYSSTMTHQYVPTSSTIHLMYVPTHQLLVSTMYPTCTSTKSPHQFHHPNMICNFLIDLVYMITYLQTFLNFNNNRLAFSSNVSLVSQD